MARMMYVNHLDYTSEMGLRQSAKNAVPDGRPFSVASHILSDAQMRQPSPYIRVDAQHRRITERHLYDQEITDRCASARRNTGCLAQWQQNRGIRLREYQL